MADLIRVLIVDDIPETRDHLTKLLGFEVDIEVVGAAASGGEALDLAARLGPDIVLMDINMPDMDGIAATEKLSTAAPMSSVIMMSVQGEADYLRRSMLAGAREFLVKPFSSDELTASIRQVHARERDKLSRISVAPVTPQGASKEPGGEPGIVVPRQRGVQGMSRKARLHQHFAAALAPPRATRDLREGGHEHPLPLGGAVTDHCDRCAGRPPPLD